MKNWLPFFCIFVFLLNPKMGLGQKTIGIIIPDNLRTNEIINSGLQDFKNLMAKSVEVIFLENERGDFNFTLQLNSEIKGSRSFDADFPVVSYPQHAYNWTGNGTDFLLQSASVQGLHFGLFGFLEEKMGFRFIHPRETIIPDFGNDFPSIEKFSYSAEPVFLKKGFHLHTMHPLELTEQLHNHLIKGGIDDIKEYVDWLARNGQNYFDFSLMREIDIYHWPAYAKQFVDYAHSRGILVGLELSLHMIQQQVFQLIKYPPTSFKSYQKQIDKNLEKLFVAPWDFINLDLTTAEFVGGMDKQKNRLKYYLVNTIKDKYNSNVLLRKHVVNEDNHVGKVSQIYDVKQEEDRHIGILLHTVMFYSLTEDKARVYENENFQHVLKDLIKESKRRDSWYYPESAYWITFDNSVPMFLLPYLSARFNDIKTCEEIGVFNHVTFTSGWEWGYWLFDWSIARWSWKRSHTGWSVQEPLVHLLGVEKSRTLITQLEIQEYYLKEMELMRYLCPFTITDEIPRSIRKTFQPRPDWDYKDLTNASTELQNEIMGDVIPKLNEFADESLNKMRSYYELKMFNEFLDGITITALRAQHKAKTLEALLTYNYKDGNAKKVQLLNEAERIRMQAQHIVSNREKDYRYDLKYIARPHQSFTAYHYGYLYFVSDLHFWKREEEQARQKKFGINFMNKWPVWRILGVE